ncbi:urease accessory protein UreF [Scopulibacillus cellulosilyticus]|uniref:Urease accessory protein UreF n=1 Tax=Scopulibacillus cellulosilyticus TaxID=2665665 RepID=A0ABW2Q1R0_9BACL
MWELLQYTDSAFPTGAFTHSYGMESLVQEKAIHDLNSAEKWLVRCLAKGWAPTDGLAILLAWHAVNEADALSIRNEQLFENLAEIDMTLTASRPAKEANDASVSTGKRLLKEAVQIQDSPILSGYYEWIKGQKLFNFLGNFSVVYGIIGASSGWPSEQTGLASAYATSAGLVAALIKLVPLGQSEGQLLLSRLSKPLFDAITEQKKKTLRELGASLPLWDIAQMRHESLYSRLFRS